MRPIRPALLVTASLLASTLPACVSSSAHASSPDLGFERVGDDVVPRFFHRAGLLPDGHVLVSGGMRLQLIPRSLISLDAISFFDPQTNTFSASFAPIGGGPPVTPTLSTARSSHTQTVLLDGRVLITGGRANASGTNPGTPVASVEVFDPADGAVTAGPVMSSARASHTATRLADGRVVVAGGGTWDLFTPGPPGQPELDAFAGPLALQRSRTGHAAVLLADHGAPGADRVLLIGGAGTGATTLELLDPDAGASSLRAAALLIGVDDLAAVRLDDGAVLIVGGQDTATGDTVNHTYLYDASADVIATAPPPPDRAAGIADHQLVPLGRYALACGGEQQVAGVDTELDYAALFDRAAGAWVATGAMAHVHDDFASVRLDDGRILLVDGGAPFFGQEAPTTRAELATVDPAVSPDIDGSGDVGFGDLLAVLSQWGPCTACPEDLDGGGDVGFGDLLIVLSSWGPCV